MQKTNRTFFTLLQAAVKNKPLTPGEKALITPDTIPLLMSLACHHDVGHLVAYVLKNEGIITRQSHPDVLREIWHAVYRNEQIQGVTPGLFGCLEHASIPFIPLKGLVLQSLYPEPWMRTSCDMDILVQEGDVERALLCLTKQLHYRKGGKTPHDISLFTPTMQQVELHHTLVEEARANMAGDVLNRVWDFARPIRDGASEHILSPEMFYFYHIAHMAKHFESGGCGVRGFIDLWLMDRQMPMDENHRDDLLEQGGLLTFAKAAQTLSRVWMDGEEANGVSATMERFVLSGGAYGSTANRVAVQQPQKGGTTRYMTSRLFLPREHLQGLYPVLRRYPWLMPVMQMRRWGRLFSKRATKKAITEMRLSNSISKDDSVTMQQFLTSIGL